MKKFWLKAAIVTVVLVFGFCAAYAGGGKKEAEKPAPPPEKEEEAAAPAEPEVDLTVPITVLVTDPHIQVVDTWKPIWEAETGGKIDVVLVPYATLEEKMWIEFRTKAGSFDIACIPVTWKGDVFGGGHVEVLDPYMEKFGYPDWDDVMPGIKNIVKWGDDIMAFPYDGDNHLFYYRTDALEVKEYQEQFKKEYGYMYDLPPSNWSQVRDLAEFFNDWDWDNDGEVEYGMAYIAQQNTQAMWSYLDFAAQYATVAGEPSNYRSNMFFDAETMEPLCNTPGWIEAMKMIKELADYAPPGLLGYGFSELRQAYVSGLTAMAIDWADIAIQAQYPEKYGSKVKGKLGYGPLPGAKKYWDRKTGQWVEKQHQVNFLDFGGWVWIIPKSAPHKDAAYKFGTYITNKEHSLLDVCGIHGYTGANPWRESHFEALDAWVRGGWDRESARRFLAGVKDILSDPYAVTDLMIPGGSEYYNVLDTHLNKVLSGEISPEDGCQRIYKDWVRITEERGKQQQKEYYRGSLGLD
ncbi:MAG: ABC transporter substrate-binding protein [Spirochaetota bacterium]